ncbi:MAG: penicillin acylase family protein [Bacteroidales bacterium]
MHYLLLRIGYLLFLLLLPLTTIAQESADSTEILWDNYGVPHIYGATARDAFYAFGWAQMNNHADLMLKLYCQGRGIAAAYWGAEFLESDKLVQLFDINEHAGKTYDALSGLMRENLDAFVQGVNDYARENSGVISERYRAVLPVTAKDVISHILRVNYLEFLAGDEIAQSKRPFDAGSNAIALSPARTSNGKAMLVINPHLPWYDYFLWFEAHINYPGYSAYGISLVGMPAIVMGFNQHLGWAHTINPIDAADRYEIQLRHDSCLLDGKYVPLKKKTVTLKVNEGSEEAGIKTYDFWYAPQGPVINRNETRGIALRIAGLGNTGLLDEYLAMSQATNFREFEGALKRMQIPMFNIIYADKEGTIFYLFNGNIPRRESGDFSYWRGPIDGSRSASCWNEVHTYEELPKLLNPSTGFIQNCNDAPWSCTYPPLLKADDYPAYFSTRSFSLRAQRATHLVLDHPKMSLMQLAEAKQNCLMEAALRYREPLILAAMKSKDPQIQKGVDILKKWDCTTDTSSRGAVLFAAWWDKMSPAMFRNPWDPEHPFTTPADFRNRKQVVDLFGKAVREVILKHGTADVAWGEVHRFRAGPIDLPANGGPGDHYGLFRTIYYTETPDKKQMAMAGETFVAIVEFGEQPKALVSLSYGNATQNGNPHRGDQLILLSRKQLRNALLTREQVNASVEKRECLQSR